MTDRVSPATYTVDEAARLLGIGRNSAYEAARRGDLPTLRVGKRILISRAGLDRMLSGAAPVALIEKSS